MISPDDVTARDATPSIPLETPIAASEPAPASAPYTPPASPSNTGGWGSSGARSMESQAKAAATGDPQILKPVEIDGTRTTRSVPWIPIAVIAVLLIAAIFYVRSRRG